MIRSHVAFVYKYSCWMYFGINYLDIANFENPNCGSIEIFVVRHQVGERFSWCEAQNPNFLPNFHKP